MERYTNLSGAGGITGYEVGSEYILVEFRNGRTYRYSHASAGQVHVERMKRLAAEGRGLTTYISQHVHDLYDRE